MARVFWRFPIHSSTRGRLICILAAVLAVTVSSLATSMYAQAGSDASGQWRHHSGDLGSTKYSPLSQIAPANVGTLRIAWRRPSIDPSVRTAHPTLNFINNFRSTPLMIDGVLYASNGVGLIEAFDPETGKTLWVQPMPAADAALANVANRGIAYWAGGADAALFSSRGQYLFAINPRTGVPIPSFGDNGRVDMSVGLGPYLDRFELTSPPIVVKDVVIVGSSLGGQDAPSQKEGPPGDVRGYDVRSGKLRWTFHVIPREGEPETSTWEHESWRYTGAGNVWSFMSADESLGYVYLPTTSASNDLYGGHRLGNNLYTTSLVCLEASTGRRIWHFQTVHHDIFDYDNPAGPILADINVGGRAIKAVVQLTKQGFAFVFDRVTGEPVWPIEERPVPPSTVPGEQASPTQPFPTRPPPFDRQGITVDDLIDFTPALRAEAVELVKPFLLGPVFSPASVRGEGPNDKKGTIQVPGLVGGADWTGGAFDPDTGLLYVPSQTDPIVAAVIPGKPEESNLRYRTNSTIRSFAVGPRGLPLLKPPYNRVTAIDLRKGDIVWVTPIGDGPRNHPDLAGLNLPPLGQAGRSSVLATKTLLFVSEGSELILRTPPGGGGRTVRALDKSTGRILWEQALDAGSTSTFMTYMHKGKQYVVIAIGSRTHTGEFVAFSLP